MKANNYCLFGTVLYGLSLVTFLYDVGMICDAKSDCLQSESCEDGRCTVPEGTMGSKHL